MAATIPGAGTDGRGLLYRFANLNVPLEVLATLNPALDNNGYAQSTGYYFGPYRYQGEDSGDSGVIPVLGRNNHVYQVSSLQTISFSVQFEGSLDGVTWTSLGSAVSSASLVSATGYYKFVRFHVSALNTTGADITKNYGVRVQYLSVAG